MIVKLWDNFKYFALMHSLHALSACFCHGKSFCLERDNTVYSVYCIHILYNSVYVVCGEESADPVFYVKYNRKVLVKV